MALQCVGRQKTRVRNWLKENVTLRSGYAWLHWDWSVLDAHKSVWFDISAATLKSPLHSDLSPSMTWCTVVFLIWVLDDTGNWQALVGLYIVNNSVWVVKMRCRTLFPHDFLLVFVLKEFNKKTRNKCQDKGKWCYFPDLEKCCLSLWYFVLSNERHNTMGLSGRHSYTRRIGANLAESPLDIAQRQLFFFFKAERLLHTTKKQKKIKWHKNPFVFTWIISYISQ